MVRDPRDPGTVVTGLCPRNVFFLEKKNLYIETMKYSGVMYQETYEK